MRYYIVNERQCTILRPATTRWQKAVDWAGGMNLFTVCKPFGVVHEGNLKSLLANGWQMADCVGLFRKTKEEVDAEATTEMMLFNFEDNLKSSDIPF